MRAGPDGARRVFSSRLKWDSHPNPLAALLSEKRKSGTTVLDLTESNPTHACFAYPENEILAALADPRAIRYDPDPRGLGGARASKTALHVLLVA